MLAGCQSYAPAPPGSQGSPAYHAGFRDGCVAGEWKANEKLQPLAPAGAKVYGGGNRRGAGRQYRFGWERGYASCFEQYTAHQYHHLDV